MGIILGVGIYQINDGTGNIWVKPSGKIPFKGDRVTVTGKIKVGVSISGRSFGVILFESDFEEGTEIQMMLRSGGEMIESTRRNSIQLMKQIKADGKKANFGLYIDCAGRASFLSNTQTEEASEVQKVFNAYDTPLLGFYSGVEIAPFIGKSRGLDWTGLLIVFAEG